MLRVKELRLGYVRLGRVKFVNILGGSVYSDVEHGCLHVSEIMTVKKFRKMYGLARYFLEHTRPKLHDYYRERTPSSILKFLPFGDQASLSGRCDTQGLSPSFSEWSSAD